MNTDNILRQLDSVVERRAYSGTKLTSRQITSLITSAQATIERLSPANSAYLSKCNSVLGQEYSIDYSDVDKLEDLMGIVDALRADYAAGGLLPVQELIRAEVFDDFLEMAQHLLETNYKDPAAVLIGGVLEQHLRKLCAKSAVPIEIDGNPKRAESMNSDLALKGVYNKLDQKSVTSWLDLRNKAAHAEYEKYSPQQVQIMLLGVRDFVSRTNL